MSKSNTKSAAQSNVNVKENTVKLAKATVAHAPKSVNVTAPKGSTAATVKDAVKAKLGSDGAKKVMAGLEKALAKPENKAKLAAAVKAVVAKKADKAEKAKGTPRKESRLGKFMASIEGKKLHINPSSNPKHGKSAKRFAAYKNGMTAAQAIEAGVWAADLEWDSRPTHSFYQGDKKVVKAAYISWK